MEQQQKTLIVLLVAAGEALQKLVHAVMVMGQLCAVHAKDMEALIVLVADVEGEAISMREIK